ncbi:uncharacterized protein LOC106457171 isoform X2 [Limulus polyphemus]|uniref:Uncharacterized protein LOC106457171 isoform X2 n=1 Tax=Limulus polyphemus TaxID=6850 RepID=A0ABM1S504_LIMPO|nr:uncharacterized protein LOC106457171 isoform X2 [Limulus polyphemus]
MKSCLERGHRLSISRSTEDLVTARFTNGNILPIFLNEESKANDVRQYPTGAEQISMSPSVTDDVTLTDHPSVLKEGHLYLSTNAGNRLRVWVALKSQRIEVYYNVTDPLPMDVVPLSGCQLEPSKPEEDEANDNCLPISLVKKGQSSVCLYSERADHKDWKEALQSSIHSCSLSMEGLNLEYGDLERTTELRRCTNHGPQTDDKTMDQKFELLRELLKQKKDLTERKHRYFPKMQSLDQTSNYAHHEALQRVTHLRQRKISTQLKMGTLQKQLQSSKKSRPHSIHQIPQTQHHFQEQLVELNRTLQEIDSHLNKSAHEVDASLRELDITTTNRNFQVKSHPLLESNSNKSSCRRGPAEASQEKLPKIYVSKSVDDCRGMSLKAKAAKLIPSPKLRRKLGVDDLKIAESSPSLPQANKRSLRDNFRDSINDLKEKDIGNSSTISKTRTSPFRMLGNFMETQLRGRIVPLRRNRSAERPFEGSKKDSEVFRSRSSSNENMMYKDYRRLTSKLTSPMVKNDKNKSLETCTKVDPVPEPKDNCIDLIDKKESALHERKDEDSSTDVQTDINPRVLAEIEAFEQLVQEYFLNQKRHPHLSV